MSEIETKVEVTYNNDSVEVLEGEVSIGSGYFIISKKLVKKSALTTVEDITNSEYIPFTSIKKLRTLNE